MKRHFLTLKDLTPSELTAVINRASELKKTSFNSATTELLRSRAIVLIFEKSSTRTRVSFEVACAQFGGSSIFLSPGDSQMSRGESISDTARIVSSMADLIVMRTGAHARLETMAEHSAVPVINALSDDFHPCQLLADLQTFNEHRGDIRDAKIAFVGDGSSNVCHSWINASSMMKFSITVGTPPQYHPKSEIASVAGARYKVTDNVSEAVKDADLVITDTWAGMGQEKEKAERLASLSAFQVNGPVMDGAASDAIFMHCLPAYRGQEVTADVIDGPKSVVFDEAENRLHAQKALIELLMS
ncbi:MAG: ornithine carbamoyltransferase [Proteobacteria bacterium]|jgi:ornithine carbamoyltransferase|nr:ornithine carbamoyltransferase [Pseudomonadota bacterium]MDB4825355.1 ornithine carbamoyltransferase [Gammaproteobacteria bacterium]MBT5624478.1 ornithine carbamoyltransferase [Pseudomonadota bacterium]MBT6070783.1 ornithine carbamoyltransferase [Pseudomonadota bacterium]MBT6657553.1 ornithine carbamoyltransferase [Pseudomonadota bacterium]